LVWRNLSWYRFIIFSGSYLILASSLAFFLAIFASILAFFLAFFASILAFLLAIFCSQNAI